MDLTYSFPISLKIHGLGIHSELKLDKIVKYRVFNTEMVDFKDIFQFIFMLKTCEIFDTWNENFFFEFFKGSPPPLCRQPLSIAETREPQHSAVPQAKFIIWATQIYCQKLAIACHG